MRRFAPFFALSMAFAASSGCGGTTPPGAGSGAAGGVCSDYVTADGFYCCCASTSCSAIPCSQRGGAIGGTPSAGGSVSFAGAIGSGGDATRGTGGEATTLVDAGSGNVGADAGPPLEPPPSIDGSGCPGVVANYHYCLAPACWGAQVALAGCCLGSGQCGLEITTVVGGPLLDQNPFANPNVLGCRTYISYGYTPLNPQRTEGGGFLDVPPDPSLACSVGASINGDASLDAATPFDASAARDASP